MASSPERHAFADLGYSRSQLDAAGDVLRRWSATETLLWGAPEADALAVALAYRAAHQPSLTSVVMGLRSMVKTVGAPIVVAQRLKRMPAIVGKLVRFPRMDRPRATALFTWWSSTTTGSLRCSSARPCSIPGRKRSRTSS